MLNNKKLNFSKKIVIMSLFGLLITGVFLYFVNSALAATDQFGMEYPAKLGLSNKDPRLVIIELVRIALGFVGIIAVIIIMYAGFLWMTSAGNEQKVEDAKRILVNAIIGLIVILCAFLIVSFIINKLNSALTNGTNDPNGGRDKTAGGLGAIGNCAIENVYPEAGQRDVPRNTSIVVTFKEAVNPDTIVDTANGNLIRTNSILIYKSKDVPAVPLTGVTGATADNRTFVFSPSDYLGSPSEFIMYSVKLTSDIRKPDGNSIFEKCGFGQEFIWSFEVSNKIDLTPPQVLGNELFPAPDNDRDDVSGALGVAASGTITVIAQPRTHSDALVNSVTPQGGTPAGASASADVHCSRSAVYTVTMLDDNYARLSAGSDNLGSAAFNNNTIAFTGYFTLTAGGPVTNGHQWNVDLTAEVLADNINVGGFIYSFVSGAPQGTEIQSDSSNDATADNIAAALAGVADIRTVRTGSAINIIARIAGADGNNIVLTASNPASLNIVPMAGGANSRQTVVINDKRDQPRNSVLQANFNEAINPVTVSGDAQAVRDYIRVVNNNGGGGDGADCSAGGNAACLSYNCVTGQCQGDFVSGKFIVSNIYRTVEFISDNLCGVNSCGERIYCLPENSNLRVDIVASPLAACDNCAAKTPYTDCTGGHCFNSVENKYHPLAVAPPLGIVDMALNSLDGNRSGDAVGPESFYSENAPFASDGDSYQWSFFISDAVDLTVPVISSVSPVHNALGINLSDPIMINFSKIMMSGSLTTGSTVIDNGRAKISHKLINLWNYSNKPAGFWVAKNNIDNTNDGNADFTRAEIRHSIFADMTSYRAQAGSGVKDIYQNCYSPSAGNYGGGNCTADSANRSCCPSGPNLNAVTVDPGANCDH